MLVAVGAGILWLGWNGFNGGDPYYAGIDAASAVLNTNIATATGLLMWMLMDWWFTKQKKPTFLGAINGMICGLVGITPSAGWVNGYGAMIVGVVAVVVVWLAWNYLSKVRPFSKVDDALGVVYTHGIAGLLGGLMVGFLADPGMVQYGVSGKTYTRQVQAPDWAPSPRPCGKRLPVSSTAAAGISSGNSSWLRCGSSCGRPSGQRSCS